MGYLCATCGGVGGLFATSHVHSSPASCIDQLQRDKRDLQAKLEQTTKAWAAAADERDLKGGKLDAAQRQVEKYRKGLEQVVVALGPKPPDCGCAGCSVEMAIALKAAQEALAEKRHGLAEDHARGVCNEKTCGLCKAAEEGDPS